MAVAAAEVITNNYELVDEYDQLFASARQMQRAQATALLESRRDQEPGPNMPLPVDALSTAHQVNHYSRRFGEGSEKHQQVYDGLVLDCQRLVGEWYRKNTWEYFPKSKHYFDKKSGEFYSHGLSIRQMTENALIPIPDSPEEEQRRVNERVEEETATIIKKLGGVALCGTKIRTVSECTDKAIEDYRNDKESGASHRGYGGYVPEIEKVMIRDITLDEDGHRVEEQIGLPGTYISHEVITEALKRRGIASVSSMNKTELHGSQIFARDDLLEFAQLLDTVAAEFSGQNIFMGEVVEPDHHSDYFKVKLEAAERQQKLKGIAEEVAQYLLFLDDIGTESRQAAPLVEDFVKKKLLNEAKGDRQVALDIFDQETADGLGYVAFLERNGQTEAALDIMRKVEQNAPGGGYCGAGSCGLEGVDTSTQEGANLKDILKAESGDTILKDTERACKCGKKSIVYAFNAKKVNKYCQNCGSFESKRTTNGA